MAQERALDLLLRQSEHELDQRSNGLLVGRATYWDFGLNSRKEVKRSLQLAK